MTNSPTFTEGDVVSRPGVDDTYVVLDIDAHDGYATLLRESDHATRGSWLLPEDGWTTAPQPPADNADAGAEPDSLPVDRIEVQTWTSEIDGVPVVQIDTDDVGRMRVYINDGPIYDQDPNKDEPWWIDPAKFRGL